MLFCLLWCVESALAESPVAANVAAESSRVAAVRKITFNGAPARAEDLTILARFEAIWGQQVPDGDYWYDNISGAAGVWGGPARGVLGAGLNLGGRAVPANASGGGTGQLTGVFINGREIHPLDYQGLTALFGAPPWPGSWWVDAQGNYGLPGQPAMGNLVYLMSLRRGGNSSSAGSYYSSDSATGSSTFVGSGCAAVSGRLSSSDSSSSYSYYVGCD